MNKTKGESITQYIKDSLYSANFIGIHLNQLCRGEIIKLLNPNMDLPENYIDLKGTDSFNFILP